jgi:hypothetical protein
MHQKLLALNEELGRKESMANDYGNLRMVLIDKGEKNAGCAMLSDSTKFFEGLGAQDKVDLVAGWIREHGCSEG